jgi:hypothetical protein
MTDGGHRIQDSIPAKLSAQIASIEALTTTLEQVVHQQTDIKIALANGSHDAVPALRSLDATLLDVARNLRFLTQRTELLDRALLDEKSFSNLERLDLERVDLSELDGPIDESDPFDP